MGGFLPYVGILLGQLAGRMLYTTHAEFANDFARDLGTTAAPDIVIETPVWMFPLKIAGCVVLLALAATFSGLTLGVMGLDVVQLEIVMSAADSEADRKNAEKILTVRRDGNLLLATLIMGNVAMNSLLSIVVAEMTTGLTGFIVSTLVLVILGELLPQAACSRHALRVGSFFTPVCRFFVIIFWPVCKPIAWVLDKMLGSEAGVSYTRREMQALLLHQVRSQELETNEARVLHAALSFRGKKVASVATPVSAMFALKSSDRLDDDTLSKIFLSGFSRVPVWSIDGTFICGILYAKDLVMVKPEACLPVMAVVAFFARTHVNTIDEQVRAEGGRGGALRREFSAP